MTIKEANNQINKIDNEIEYYLKKKELEMVKMMDGLNKNLLEFEVVLSDSEKSVNTIRKYKNNITVFINYISDKDFNKKSVIEFKEFLKEKSLRDSTINNYIISVNKFLKFIGKQDLCIKALKQQKKFSIKYSISKSDYKRLLRNSLKYDEEDYIILRILAETGIRVSEMSYFIVEKLDKTMAVTKKGKTREITISLDLLRCLRKFCREHRIKKGYIVYNKRTGKCYADSTIWRRLKKVAGRSRVNLKAIHPHAFRHYFGVRYLETYPEDYLGLADILGHSSLETTRIYSALTAKEKELKLRNVKF